VARLLAFAMTQPESVARDSRRLWLGYGAMCVGMFMAILDIQVVASSLTNIAAALDTASRLIDTAALFQAMGTAPPPATWR
jgi:hypothetical protein